MRAGARAAVRMASARRPRLAVFGVVIGASGGPDSGYRVAVLLPGAHHHSPGPSALANADGMFALNGELRPGKYTFEITKGRVLPFRPPPGVWPPLEYKFEASKHGATVRVPAKITPFGSWYALLNLKLPGATTGPRERGKNEPGVAVFGQITESDGVTPLVGASLGICRTAGRGLPQIVTAALPNRLGLFVLKKGRLDPGRYWISLAVHSRHPMGVSTVGLSALTVTATPRRDIVLRVREDAGSLEGRVVDSKGRPVRRATVTLEGTKPPSVFRFYTAETNAEGRYLLEHVHQGAYTASVVSGKHATLPVVVTVVVGNKPTRRDFRLPRQFGG